MAAVGILRNVFDEILHTSWACSKFSVCFCDILGASEQGQLWILKGRRKGRRERWRNSGMRPHRGTACLSCSRRTMAEGVFVPLCGCWSGSCGICSHPVFIPCIYQTLLLQFFFFLSTLAFIHSFLKISFWLLWS